jgi:lipoate-protein ligase A
MILWRDGAHDPAENMRRDARLLARAAWGARSGDAAAEPVLRVFAFDPPGITLGYAQDPARTLDVARCRADGVPWAVRPTGGRAIFHAREWTYSFSAPVADPEWGGSLAETYARVSSWIRASLVRLGVPAEFAPAGARSAAADTGSAARTACFAATARHEIVLGGRKLAGSAQRRTSQSLLQQGSVLLGPGHERLADYVVATPADRETLRASLAESATAGDFLGGGVPLDRWADALAASLREPPRRWDGTVVPEWLTGFENDSYTRVAS